MEDLAFCPQAHSSDIADAIKKGMGSIGGLAGSVWARLPRGMGGPHHSGSNAWETSSQFSHPEHLVCCDQA
eukprot:1157640-Pelagomonas_calceolata.AAC.4